ncbi:hypothetical protein PDESU_05861 [Pontiella desulfatans]|uniref:Outer membrane protein beta-barrel domain-containing protein n=1 Tax=Pontiella desulfatans TaxID=2750659 RepID=A0A6C2UB56_PONDE|nr:hypothetical protein [Pontiella desulfatans]VGO17265.1 hypothetical protein PDESU_05861 [Pontiella desulfatans]
MKPSIKHQASSIPLLFLTIALATPTFALDTELHGFVDGRAGVRTQNDPYEDDRSLTELRLQLDSKTYFDWGEFNARGDLVYDDLATDQDDLDLNTGKGFFDLRELNLLFTPVDWSDVKIGRQILTWGTGDLLFINDLFPKDWNSFLLGRDEEYLKAPSDALFASFFPAIGSFDVAYMPRMDADRYIDGSRVSYWNPGLQSIAGQNAVIDAGQRDEWFKDHEISGRFYRPLLSYEAALYAYHGYWKSPMGANFATGNAYFPRMNAYGGSVRGSLGSGLANLELGYYDSREDSSATQSVPNDEFRFLMGYEREVAKDLTAGMQYYLEWMMDHDGYEQNYNGMFGTTATARDEFRHVLTLRLTQMLMNQNLMLGLFTFYSPSDNDAYFRPVASYKVNDHWTVSANGNWFIGEDDHTFFGQFRYNSNVNLGVRYSF